jgi:hypothetical protein
VAHPGGQHRQPGLHVGPLGVPGDQGGDGEAVAQVVEPRSAPTGRGRDPGGLEQAGERGGGVGVVEPGAATGEEEAGSRGARAQLVAAGRVGRERRRGGLVQRHLTGLAQLGTPDREHPLLEIHVRAVQRHRLTGAQPGDRHQPDQGLEARRPKRVRQRAGGDHQRGDLRRGEQIRRETRRPTGQQTLRWDLGVGLNGLEVRGEAADHRQPRRPPGRARRAGLGGPPEGGLGGDPGEAPPLAVADEIGEHASLLTQRVAHTAAHPQVVLGRSGERAHRRAPGHGRTSRPRAARSSLA